MNELYKKIYNAVNEGIQKALLIDPDQNDVSINYSYHKVNNGIYSQQEFNDAANKFIENLNIDDYNKMLSYSLYGLHQYQVKNFEEFIIIFNFSLFNTNKLDLSWVNTTNALTFIMNDGKELSLNEIDNKEDIIFIKFNNIKNLNHSVIIHKNLLIEEKAWSNILEEIKYDNDNDKRNNGYENTKIIKDNYNLDKYPAFEYCINLKNDLKLYSLNYEAYLPSLAELEFLSKNITLINYILKYVNGKELDINSEKWWSSTQYTATYTWGMRYNSISGYYKYNNFLVLPFFTKIN